MLALSDSLLLTAVTTHCAMMKVQMCNEGFFLVSENGLSESKHRNWL